MNGFGFMNKSQVGMSIAVQIAANNGKPFPLGDAKGFSLSYLEQIVAKLKRAGLVKSTRGPGGGYVLTKPAKQITLRHVIDATYPQAPAAKTANAPADAAFNRLYELTLACADSITVQDALDGKLAA